MAADDQLVGSEDCWGSNIYGRASLPGGGLTSVSAGWRHTCGLRTDGGVACWGADHFDQATPPEGKFAFVSAGWRHTCGLRTDGGVACWGLDSLSGTPWLRSP